MADVQAAVAFLKKTSTTDGASLYDQLTNLVVKVLDERPSNPVDVLETALLVKKGTGAARDAPPVVPAMAAPADAARAAAAANLYGTPEVPIDPDSGEPVAVEAPNEYECEDVLGDAALFDALGIGLGRTEMQDVALAVQALGEDPQRAVLTVRFFGKFLGTHADYYVFETTPRAAPEEPPPAEEGGGGKVPLEWNAGANAYTYHMCNHLGGPLTQLPPVAPEHVVAARRVKRLLTGRLTSAVSSYPAFPGQEAHYLRAQIARIAATTTACPRGIFVPNEDGGVDRAEDYAPLEAREMAAAASWVHRNPHLKRQGRCEVFKREVPEGEEDEEAFEYTEDELEEGPEPLAPLEADHDVMGAAAWSPLLSSASERARSQVAGLRSNLWPGAACACQGPRFCNVYVGWGVKAGPFVPAPPPPVAIEFDASLVESAELPPKPKGADGEEDAE